MTSSFESATRKVGDYYTEKVETFGPTARGVDWNGAESQHLRFAQLLKVCAGDDGFSLVDLGCGYGELWGYLTAHGTPCNYTGIDLSEKMVQEARDRYGEGDDHRFTVGALPEEPVDYIVASGIFNVRLDENDDAWLDYCHTVLDAMHKASRKGFAFNWLTSYSDAEKMRDYLYYADPGQVFDHCKRNYSPHVALLHDYGLYEFTILVRKQP